MEAFFHNLLTVVQQVAVMFILIAVGFTLAKLNKFGKPTAAQLTTILLWIITPCTIIKSFMSLKATPDRNQVLLLTALAFAVSEVIGAVLARLTIRKGVQEQRCVLQFAVIFSNCGFMGFPFLQSLFSGRTELLAEIMIYGAVIIGVFNLLSFKEV